MIGRTNLRDVPLGRKLKGAILLVSLSAVFVAGLVFLIYEWLVTREAFSRQVEIMAEVLGDQTTATLEFNQAPQAETILKTLQADAQIAAAALYDRQGRLFARYLRPEEPAASIPLQPSAAGRRYEEGHLLVFAPVGEARAPVGTILLRSDLSEAWTRLAVDGATMAVVLLAAALAALWLSDRLGEAVLRPVHRLAEAVDAVARAQDFGVRVEGPGSADELGRLVSRFNEMLAEIQSRDAALGRARETLERRVEERTRELADANRELEGFSYSVSHDLKAPLRSIDGYNRMLLEDYAPSLDAQAKEWLHRSIAAAGRMNKLIEDFLTLARVSRAELRKGPVDVSAMAAGVVEDLRRQDPSRDVDVVIAPGLRAEGDATQLSVVLENLLSNAWKFTGRKPKARIEVGSRTQDGQTVFFVADDGEGFDMAFANKLFRPFERLHSAKDFPGTGIGLATVKRIIERHGGRVWADALPGKGATFSFTLGP
ncbi:MAG TPA: ATP-binding protein [Planctomycetota bacterium]|nr:ATP-binding protein [Planctomycetota bacterium]